MTKNRAGRFVLEIVMVLLSILFLYPLFLTIINSLKSFQEVMTDVIALPKRLAFENYSYVWEFINYPRLFLNNAVITILGLAGIILISSIAAYKLARTKSKASSIIYMLCIMPMLIPFQSIMLTVLQMAKNFHLSDSTWGLGILYWGFGAPLALFIYHGFVKGIPKEIDESATIDGASGFRLFFSVIFPLLEVGYDYDHHHRRDVDLERLPAPAAHGQWLADDQNADPGRVHLRRTIHLRLAVRDDRHGDGRAAFDHRVHLPAKIHRQRRGRRRGEGLKVVYKNPGADAPGFVGLGAGCE